MVISKATEDDLQEVLQVLNEATLNLHRKGINQWSYPWEAKDIKREIENGNTFVLRIEDIIIASFTISEIDYVRHFGHSRKSMYLSKIAILPEFQGRHLGSQITSFACSFAREMGLPLYLNCWAGNTKLREFYGENGFEYLGDYLEEDYFVSVFEYKYRM